MIFSKNNLIKLFLFVGKILIPSYNRTYILEINEAFNLEKISAKARLKNATFITMDKKSLVFRIKIPVQGWQQLQWQVGELRISINKTIKHTYEVNIVFSQLKLLLSTFIGLVVFGGVVLKIPVDIFDAMVNLVLIIAIWHILTLSVIFSNWNMVTNFIKSLQEN